MPYVPRAPEDSETHLFSPSAAEVVPLVDWTPFLAAWGFKGGRKTAEEDSGRGEKARELLRDAERELADLRAEIRCAAAVLPANSDGDDVEIYDSEKRDRVRERLCFLRMQRPGADGRCLCLSDFVAPKESGIPDWIGAFATGVFGGAEARAEALSRGDDYAALLRQLLFDRLAEASAEWLHREVAEKIGRCAAEPGKAPGIRPAPGYPACPDHTEKAKLWRLLDAERNAGIRLTENFAMDPAPSVCGWMFAHPEARFFSTGKIGEDQLSDYARRKGWTDAEARRWLAPVLEGA